jgi:hypothetical protein
MPTRREGGSLFGRKLSRMATSVADAARSGAQKYSEPAGMVWSAVGHVATNVPYVGAVYAMCDEVIQLFSASLYINDNCREVVRWASNMQVSIIITIAL